MEIREELARLAPGVSVLSSTHAPSKVVPYEKWKAFLHEGTLEDVRMKKAYLVSGIGNPAAFKKTAKEAGLRPVGEMPFPDHHRYTEEDLRNAISEAKAKGAELIVMTEKDAVKMLSLDSLAESDIPFYVLEIAMTLPREDREVLEEFLHAKPQVPHP